MMIYHVLVNHLRQIAKTRFIGSDVKNHKTLFKLGTNNLAKSYYYFFPNQTV